MSVAGSRTRATLVGVGLLAALVAAVLASASLGQFSAPLADVLRALMPWQSGTSEEADFVRSTLWSVRFPRIAMGVLVGAALGVAGSLTQSLFGNPLAEPSVIGITSGASVGAAISIGFGATAFGILTTPAYAFAFGLGTALLVWTVAQRIPAQRAISLLLVGIAVNALAGAATAFIFLIAPSAARDAVVFWQLGSLAGTTWVNAGITAALVAVGLAASLPLLRSLDVLALGDRAAEHVGVRVPLVRVATIVIVALLTGAAVSFAGVIGFVGLIVPHAIRLIVGPAHWRVMPLSMLGGALLITLADLGARTLVPLTDLPIGMLTSAIGAPLFLVLLHRTFASDRGRMQ